ncbi:MAG: radical SAM protein [Candidatus Omnitrophica bacterium]|nr:radical SAM protein [Candidatus Omnitrophota bacterium]
MNVLFVYPNINGFHEDTYSFGLASIVSITRSHGHTPKVVILKTTKDYSNVFAQIEDFKPRIIGFSSVSSQFGFIKDLAQEIKVRFPGIITVCGGVHPTIDPQCLLETEFLDTIFVGESELSFADFLSKVEKNLPYFEVNNLGYRKNGKIKVNELRPLIQDLDPVPYPDREIYPFGETLKNVGYAPFLFSRGCPYLCSYCSNHAIAKAYSFPRNFTRYRSVGSAIGEIESVLNRFSVNKILIVDDIFGLDKKWRDEFCVNYKKMIGIGFQCLLRANLIDEDFIRQLKMAGCFRISIGVESGNDYVRNNIMNRHMSKEQIINAFDLARKYGIQTNALNIIGVPGETEDMIRDTIRLNRRIRPTSSGINVFYPYKGTVLGNQCFEKGLVDEAAYANFSRERRETVLNYPLPFKRKLSYYRDNWEVFVYPFSFKRRLARMLRNTAIWGWLSFVKRMVIKFSFLRK